MDNPVPVALKRRAIACFRLWMKTAAALGWITGEGGWHAHYAFGFGGAGKMPAFDVRRESTKYMRMKLNR